MNLDLASLRTFLHELPHNLKCHIVEDLAEHLDAGTNADGLPNDFYAELGRREAEFRKDPDSGITWEQVVSHLRNNKPIGPGAQPSFELWLPTLLFGFLRCMDAEAVADDRSRPFGLLDYGRYARPDLTKPKGEVEWSRRLAALFRPHGFRAENEIVYPPAEAKSRRKCDLVFYLGNGRRFWVEVKGAWRSEWGGNSKIYRAYLLHPLVPGLESAKKSHSAALDLLKLSALAPPDADFVGQLLVGFDTPDDPMDGDVAELVAAAGLADWSGASDQWMSPTVPDQRVRVWFWWRTAGGWTVPLPPGEGG